MIITPDLSAYLLAASTALTATPPRLPDTARLSDRCPECDETITDPFDPYHLVAITPGERLIILVGCEGYWTIDPNMLGIPRAGWTGTDTDEESPS